MPLVRVLMATVAVVVCAWFALGIRQARNIDRASAIITSGTTPSPRQASEIKGWLDAAGWLNPDRQVQLLRGKLDQERGERAAARRILLPATAAEPMNLQAWVYLAQVTTPPEKAFEDALHAIARLDPKVR
jgi:hypothetical protein